MKHKTPQAILAAGFFYDAAPEFDQKYFSLLGNSAIP